MGNWNGYRSENGDILADWAGPATRKIARIALLINNLFHGTNGRQSLVHPVHISFQSRKRLFFQLFTFIRKIRAIFLALRPSYGTGIPRVASVAVFRRRRSTNRFSPRKNSCRRRSRRSAWARPALKSCFQYGFPSHCQTTSSSEKSQACCKYSRPTIKRGDVAGRPRRNTKPALIAVFNRSQSIRVPYTLPGLGKEDRT